ncbi:ParA family protein [Clostridioides difficile]|uniref:ParA family protein n=1 Tax=Clostridioides difficile TaxID=1496 RepID=UPI0010349CE1|nr:AAA family ATPase [Clostridioides difficile]
MKIVSLFNVKGGVGKTTLAYLISLNLSKKDKKVLIFDGDTQANFTQFIYKIVHNKKTILDAFKDDISAEELIIKSPLKDYPNIDLIPSDLSLSVLSEYLTIKTSREKVAFKWFKKNISTLKNYDYILIDLSPSYDLIARNFLFISDSIITPLGFQDIASIRGCELFYQKYNEDLEEMGEINEAKRAIVINSYTSRKLTSGDVFMDYLERFDSIKKDLTEVKISESTIVKNCVLNKLSIDDYCRKIKKAHKVREELNDLIEELINKEVL